MSDIDSHTEDENVFFCQVETLLATKDYLRGGLCVRLIAVTSLEFSADRPLSGVTTFTIDIDFWLFRTLNSGVLHRWSLPQELHSTSERRDVDPGPGSRWMRLQVTYLTRGKRKNYLYKTFSTDQPKFFDVLSLSPPLDGPSIPQLAVAQHAASSMRDQANDWPFVPRVSLNSQFVFDTFHVGQGMCSLVHDGSHGILLDLGAGKPVTRETYQARKIRNDLYAAVRNMKRLVLVISHADADHWRIMGWDPILLKKIDKIYAPAGAISLAMQDKAVSTGMHGLSDTTWQLDPGTTLQLWRSKPSRNDQNGECLVAVFKSEDRRVLVPGDYVYERFMTDSNVGINALHNAKYAAVVVPHHGDAASSQRVVSAADVAKAFFSAGTNQSWGHPTVDSLAAHRTANFNNISDPTQPDIVKVNLI